MLAVACVVLVLGLLGSLAGPSWSPTPVTQELRSADLDTGIVAPDAADPVATDAVGAYDWTTSDLQVQLDGAVVTARLTAPVDAPPDRPAMLFLHGAGTGLASNFAEQARALASAGVYVLVPAKRTDTYTTRDRDYVAMARDYLVSWRALADLPGVDPDRVSIYAESEGAYVAPVAAVLEPAVEGLVLVSAPVVRPREQGAFAMDSYLRNTHVPTPVLRAVPRATGGGVPGGGFAYADFDVRPWQRQVEQPVLMVYGTGDTSMPLVQAPLLVRDDLAQAGNDALTVRYFDGANHAIRQGVDLQNPLTPGFTDLLVDWTSGLPGTGALAPQVAGAQPTQAYLAQVPPAPRWFADGDMLVVTAAAAGLLLVGGALVRLADVRDRRRRPRPRVPSATSRAGAAAGLAGLASLVAFVGYGGLVAHLALNYRTNDVVAIGGWVLVQATGVLAAAVLVRSVQVALRERRAADGPAGAVAAVSWSLVHAGAVAFMLIAAYWGVYPAVV